MTNPGCPIPASTQAASLRAQVAVLEAQLASARAESAARCARFSHELRPIFQAIEGLAGVLLERTHGSLTDRQAHCLERLKASALRGDGLVRGLARLSTIAGAQVQPRPVEMGPLVRQCIQELLPSLQQRPVEWELSDAQWPLVTADPILLRIAMEQLLAHAVKAARGSARPRIRVSVESTAEGCSVAVGDSGDGPVLACAPVERRPLASEFDSGAVELALVKCIAQRHGGRVRAQAWPGAGALVTMTLPRPAAPAGLEQQPAEGADDNAG